MESRSLAKSALGPNSAAVPLHDPLADCQPQPGSRVLIFVQALEQAEDSFRILRLKSDSIVSHSNRVIARLPDGRRYEFEPELRFFGT